MNLRLNCAATALLLSMPVMLFPLAARAADFRMTSNADWRAIAPVGNLQGTPIESVGLFWESVNQGWNGSLTYDDSDAAGWRQSLSGNGFHMWGSPTGETPSYFRRVLTLDGPPISAFIDAHVDDDSLVWVNGSLVHYDTSGGASSIFNTDVTPLLVPGDNLIAIKAHDSFGAGESAGIVVDGVMSSTPTAVQRALIPRGAEWKYLDDGSDQGTAWRVPSFDDSAWRSGPAQLGYGDGDEQTVVSDGGEPENKHITTYFRTTFETADPSIYESLAMSVLRDDGVAVYLNGRELFRNNLPSDAGYRTTANFSLSGSDENQWLVKSFDPSLLRQGANTIAVEIQQDTSSSSDISFDLAITGVEGRHRIAYTNFAEPAENSGEYVPGPGGAELGFRTVTSPTAGVTPLAATVASSSAPDSPVLGHRSVMATTTFDEVDLADWQSVTVSMLVNVRQTGYETEDFLHLRVTNGIESIDLFEAVGDSATYDDVDFAGDQGYRMFTAFVPDHWQTAQLVIASSSNSSSDAERYDFDNVDFRGVRAIPEPSALWLAVAALAAGVPVLRRRARCVG